MGLGAALFLIAVGAILAFGISINTGGAIELHTIGLILLAVGILGAILSMVFWSSWGGPTYFTRRRSRTYIDDDVPRRSRTYIDDDVP